MLFIIIVIAYNNNSVRQKSRFTLKRYSVSNFFGAETFVAHCRFFL